MDSNIYSDLVYDKLGIHISEEELSRFFSDDVITQKPLEKVMKVCSSLPYLTTNSKGISELNNNIVKILEESIGKIVSRNMC